MTTERKFCGPLDENGQIRPGWQEVSEPGLGGVFIKPGQVAVGAPRSRVFEKRPQEQPNNNGSNTV